MKSYSFDADKLIGLCPENDIAMLGVFGSTARGEATKSSDVDLLVRFSKPKSLLSAVALERRLSDAIGRPVDLVTEAALSPYLRDRILQDVEVLYEA